MVEKLRNFINGEWVESKTADYTEVRNPATDEVIALCPNSTLEEVDITVRAAKEAFEGWRFTPPPARAKCLFNLRAKVEQAEEDLIQCLVNEHGKTYSDASGEIVRSLEFIEHACAIPELLKGSYSEDVGTRVDTHYIHEPLGPFIFIPPFNFPAMNPLYCGWALACGNPIILKPNVNCPMTVNKIAELAQRCGFPKGIFNVLNGSGSNVGNGLVRHPDTAGVTFVGSSDVAEQVYKTATSLGKRAQCQGGANNMVLVARDAILDDIIPNLASSCFGHTSQRCFAVSNILIVEEIYEKAKAMFIEEAKKYRLGYGLDKDATMGPVVSKKALKGILEAVDQAIKDGAKLVLDGRNPQVPKYPKGYFLAPTLFEAEPGMEVFDEEIFGPVRCLKRVKDMAEAVSIINQNKYGHTAVIYTENGGWAREFVRRLNIGHVGVNVGTPAPIAFYPCGGRKISMWGDIRGRANDAVNFYTDKKVVVSRWHSAFEESKRDKYVKLF
ncbi:MAG: aldehyde dehydrogenase family protein [Thermodesulfobacteriota bacterium]|jgi:malonate-semialdehyde dehydrogenase (acetylating)/methylmalonate-semialdehyde dehydrogenase